MNGQLLKPASYDVGVRLLTVTLTPAAAACCAKTCAVATRPPFSGVVVKVTAQALVPGRLQQALGLVDVLDALRQVVG